MVNCAHALIYIVLARDPPPSDEGQVECDFEAAAGRELEKLYEAAKLGMVKGVRAIVHDHVERTDRVTNWGRRHPHAVFVDNQLEVALAREIGLSWETL
jgi:hypothetical protein